MCISYPNNNKNNRQGARPSRPGGPARSGPRSKALLSRPVGNTFSQQNFVDVTPFPSHALVTLRSAFSGVASNDGTTGTTTGAQTVIQLNSLFEPVDGQSLQPYGFDQMATLYGRYKVVRTTVRISISSATSSNTMMLLVMAQPTTGGGTLSAVDGIAASARPNVSTVYSPATTSAVWQRTYNIAEVAGMTQREFDGNVEEFAAVVAANPTRMPTLSFAVCSKAAGVTSQSVYYHVLIDQQVEFFSRITLAAS